MLLTIDIGNTNIKIGVYQAEQLLANWRMATERLRLADEYAALISNLFALAGLEMGAVKGCAISCVVPPLTSQFRRISRDYLGVEPVILGVGTETGLRYAIDTPNEAGRRPGRQLGGGLP